MVDWRVFYAAFNSISVTSRRQLTLFMSSWVSPVLGWGSEASYQRTVPQKKPRGSSAARTQDPWITSQTLYHWATQDPTLIQEVAQFIYWYQNNSLANIDIISGKNKAINLISSINVIVCYWKIGMTIWLLRVIEVCFKFQRNYTKCISITGTILWKFCYKQVLLFSQCFPQLSIFKAPKCGIVW